MIFLNCLSNYLYDIHIDKFIKHTKKNTSFMKAVFKFSSCDLEEEFRQF